jgi:hypothetical protein
MNLDTLKGNTAAVFKAIKLRQPKAFLDISGTKPLGTPVSKGSVGYAFIPLVAQKEREVHSEFSDRAAHAHGSMGYRDYTYYHGWGAMFIFSYPDTTDARIQRAVVLTAAHKRNEKDYEVNDYHRFRVVTGEEELMKRIAEVQYKPGLYHLEPRHIMSICANYAFPLMEACSAPTTETRYSEGHSHGWPQDMFTGNYPNYAFQFGVTDFTTPDKPYRRWSPDRYN